MSPLINALVFSPTRKVVASVFFRAYSSASPEVPQYETLAVTVPKKHVYHVELNRPKKLNTFSHNMWSELKQCFDALSDNADCRVVMLSGQGKHFTGGIDLNSFVQHSAKAGELDDVARKARFLHQMITEYQSGITAVEDCVKPVLTVVHNACVGAGVDLITAADIRYCTENAWFQVKEVDIGLAADVGTLQRLPKVIGSASVARELCFTARKLLAKEALDIGLVSKVFPDRDVSGRTILQQTGVQNRPGIRSGRTILQQTGVQNRPGISAIEQVLVVAEEIASKSPVAVQTTKQSLVYSQSRPTKDGLMHIALLNQLMLQSEDLSKAAVAQATKSDPPEFEDL